MHAATICIPPVIGHLPPIVACSARSKPAARTVSPSPSKGRRASFAECLSPRPPVHAPREPQGEAPDATVVDPALVKRAVKAAALGNAMEWFDFGVYSYIAVTLGKVFFPSGQPDRPAAVDVRRLRRGLPRPPPRRHGLRPARRPRRPPEGPRRHHDHDGGGHLRHRPDPVVRHDRRRRARSCSWSPAWSRASPPAASTRAPPPSSPSTRPTRSAASSAAGWSSAPWPATSAAPAWSR